MKQLEDALDNCIDNSGTYRLLDFRRRYTECGNMVLAVKEILSRIDKGYYPMQMQNSYVLQGEVLMEFRFLEERYELIKSTVLKDFDTYTSIINNNINRNARLLSIISLVGVVLNFMFGSLLAANPLLGIIGRPVGCGPVCGGPRRSTMSAAAAMRRFPPGAVRFRRFPPCRNSTGKRSGSGISGKNEYGAVTEGCAKPVPPKTWNGPGEDECPLRPFGFTRKQMFRGCRVFRRPQSITSPPGASWASDQTRSRAAQSRSVSLPVHSSVSSPSVQI